MNSHFIKTSSLKSPSGRPFRASAHGFVRQKQFQQFANVSAMPFKRTFFGGQAAKRTRFMPRVGVRRPTPGFYRQQGFYGRRYRAPKWANRSQKIARALGVEKKFMTDEYTDNTLAVTWQGVVLVATDHGATEGTTNLLECVQGDGPSERIGRKIVVTDMSCRWTAHLNDTVDVEAPPTPTRVRCVVYLDKQCNGAALTAVDLFANIGNQIDQFRNMSTVNRFKILKDFEVVLKPNGGAGAGTAENDWTGDMETGQFHLKNLNLPIEYSAAATTGDVATIRSNIIGMIVVGSVALQAGFSCMCRIRYTDV